MEARDRVVRSRLVAQRDLPTVACEQSIFAILTAIGQESLEGRRCARGEVRSGDVLDLAPQQVGRFVVERGPDAATDGDEGMGLVSHEHERILLAAGEFLVVEPRSDDLDRGASVRLLIRIGQFPTALRFTPRVERLGNVRRGQCDSDRAGVSGRHDAPIFVSRGVYARAGFEGTSPRIEKESSVGIISWLVVGAIAGYLAGFLVKGDEGLGVIGHIALGIVGGLVGGFLAGLVTGGDYMTGITVASVVVAIIGAVVLVWGYNFIRSRSKSGGGTV